ncbi:MAG TPA: hypothetical protein VFW65_07935 [Pseudonocardiaceae bacterium]|nr:hypothetical protein [Pseudonocardiaceae bacterium]
MTPLSALASTILLLGTVITIGYLGSCVFWPFSACRRCGGYGHVRGWLGGIRFCPACDGTGLRLRFGRRVINTFRRLYRDSTTHRNR